MPIYEYLCGECGHELEVLQKISEDALVFCPECGVKSLKKKVSAVAFRLKGTGWYETDFKNNGKKKPEDKDKKPEDKDKKPAGKSTKASTDAADSATGGNDAKGGKETSKSKDTESSGKSSSSKASD